MVRLSLLIQKKPWLKILMNNLMQISYIYNMIVNQINLNVNVIYSGKKCKSQIIFNFNQ